MRLIDADDLKAKIMIDAPDFMDGGSSITKAFIMAMLGSRAATPTIDAVQVVRCKDCKHKEESVSPSWEAWCNRLHCGCDLDWFCADGERNPTQTNTKNNALDCVKGNNDTIMEEQSEEKSVSYCCAMHNDTGFIRL